MVSYNESSNETPKPLSPPDHQHQEGSSGARNFQELQVMDFHRPFYPEDKEGEVSGFMD